MGIALLIDIVWVIAVLLMPFVLLSINSKIQKQVESLEELKLIHLGLGDEIGLSRNQLMDKYEISSINGAFVYGGESYDKLDTALLKARLNMN